MCVIACEVSSTSLTEIKRIVNEVLNRACLYIKYNNFPPRHSLTAYLQKSEND